MTLRVRAVQMCLCAASMAAACAAKSDPHTIVPDAWIDETVEQTRADFKSPSIVIAVLRRGRPALLKGYGVTDRVSGQPATPETLYQIASVTKTFVGLLAAKLAARGKVDLDAPVTDYAPDLCFQGVKGTARITLRHLLTHRSGLPSNPANRKNISVPGLPDGFDPTIAEPYTLEQLHDGLAQTPPLFAPGERYYYSNLGMHLAGYVLARAVGQRTFADALHAHILGPLHMADSFVRTSPARDAGMATPYAYGDDQYYKVFPLGSRAYYRIPPWTFGEVTGGLGLSSNVKDLARYVAALLEAGRPGAALSQDVIDLLLTRHAAFVAKDEFIYEMGLGWRIGAFGPFGTVYTHGGHNDGHHAYVVFSRDHGLAVIALTNGAHAANRALATKIMLKLMQQASKEQGNVHASKR